jgi:adenylate kinase
LRKIIFVGGIHGVGKTYLCNEICKKIEVPHFSASQLIRQQNEEEMNTLKNVTDVKGNQDALIMAINTYVNDISVFLLDGHFCILNSMGEIERIPNETFERMEISCFLVLVDEVEEIRIRLKSRDNIEYSKEMLEKFQSEEISYAKQLSETLRVPILIHKNREDREALYQFLKTNSQI